MSAPETHTTEEQQAHKPVITIMRAGMVFGAAMMIGLFVWLVANGQEPREVDTQIDARTGERIEND